MSKKKSYKKQRENKESFWNRNIDIALVVVTIALLLLGLLTLLSASSSVALSESGDAYYYVKKQVQALIIGIIVANIALFFDYRKYNSKIFTAIAIIGIIGSIIFVELMGIEEGGATRWVYIGGISFQPSEFVKLAMIILMASILTKLTKQGEIKQIGKGFFLPLFIAAAVAGAIFLRQNHLSAALVIGAIAVAQMFVAGSNLFFIIGMVVLTGAGAFLYVKNISSNPSDFRSERILAWLNPEKYYQGKGWQIMQSLYAIGSGGILGLGMGESRQKQDFLPEPQNDFIASIYAEEFGFVGVTILLALFLVLLVRAAMIAQNTKDMFGKILAVGITTLFAVEIILNLLVITSLVPVTGIGLPFFSYGGTAMLVNLAAIGILLNINRINKKESK